MSRTSRIKHPPGGRFVQLHAWAVEAEGREVAAVLGLLDFLDRAQPDAGRTLCGPDRIIEELRGIVGRDAVRRAIARLVELRWVTERRRTTPNARSTNIVTHVGYAVNAEAINEFLRNPGNQESPELLDSVSAGITGFSADTSTDISADASAGIRNHLCVHEDIKGERDAESRGGRVSPAFEKTGRQVGDIPDTILELYHSNCPHLPRAIALTKERASAISQRWQEGLTRGDFNDHASGLVWFERFFRRVAASDFLCGRTQGRDGQAPFQANLDWLMAPRNHLKVVEGNYDNRLKSDLATVALPVGLSDFVTPEEIDKAMVDENGQMRPISSLPERIQIAIRGYAVPPSAKRIKQ